MGDIDIAKYNISRLVHSTSNSSHERAILRDLGLSAFPRAKALSVLLEILNVKIMIKEQKEKWKDYLNE